MYPKEKFNPRYLKLIFSFIVTISILELKSQDSLLRLKLRLFDLQVGMGIGDEVMPAVTKSTIGDYTRHKEYTSEEFLEGYSDTISSPYRWYDGHHNLGLKPEIGFNSLFQFYNTKSKILRRVKLRASMNYFYSTWFKYNLGYERVYKADTLYYVNPSYPPLIEKQYVRGDIRYTYSSLRVFGDLGLNFDVIQKRYIIVYAGFLYGAGVGTGKFRVQMRDSTSNIDEEFRENLNFTSRFIFPIGILLRAKPLSKRNINVFGEIRPGFYMLKIKNGAEAQGNFFSVNAGVRFSLQPHK